MHALTRDANAPQSRMASTPSDLNEISDNDLRAFATDVLNCLRDPSGQQPLPAPHARFITADVLLRLHDIIVDLRRLQDSGGWTKQAFVAKAVATFTGVKLQRCDADYVGNAQDTYLRDYKKTMAKAIAAERIARERARKAGREERADIGARVSELKQRIFQCKFGGVPRNIIVPSACPPLPILRQPVPVQRVKHADEVNLQLQHRLIELQEKRTNDREMNLNLLALCTAIDKEQRAREQAERKAAEMVTAQEEAASQAASQVQLLKRRIQDAEKATNKSKGDVFRLQAQLGSAHLDVARAKEREHKARENAKAASLHAQSLQAEAASKAAVEKQQLKSHLQDMKRECSKANGQVLRLQSQLGAAHIEVARATEREHKLRIDAEMAAREAASSQVAAVAKVTARLHDFKEQARHAERQWNETKGTMERLGSQLGRALVEAARAAECERKATQSMDQLKTRLKQQEQDAADQVQHLRTLKASMAKRARDADRRASKADSYLAEVASLREKLRAIKKEMNTTRVQLNLEVEREIESSDEDDDECEIQEDYAEEEAEAVVALKRMKAMPTWRAVRGKGAGRGEKKLEWGTRLSIYALLAMMIPASAVGMAIVAIVKRTAPWLNPTAPTYETVKRCRFELRFIEEALAGRRIAAAHRVRSIGFDETTKFGNASLTSNVQIEPTEGAELEDVILRAAYCPLGATSELVCASIETKCFSRLRDFLRRWKAKFEDMHPNSTWTGPDPAGCSMHRLGGGGAIISDTCTTARKSRRLLAVEVARQVEGHIGTDAWEAMNETERHAAVRTHNVDCWQHMRNIFLAEMSAEMARHVKAELQPELDTFSAWERMSTDFTQLLRASFKEFHHSCRYYKGQGRSYTVWLRETHPTSFAIHLERAEGGRQEVSHAIYCRLRKPLLSMLTVAWYT